MSATRLVSLVRFRNLRTRLTVIYMGLFGLALLLAALAVVTAVTNSTRRVVRDEMTAAGAVYSQLWSARSSQLQQGAGVLAQDYGFREAVATNDEATVRSALDNLRARQGVDGALILGIDGHVTATGLTFDDAALDRLFTGLESGRIESGVLAIDGQAFQVVAAPVNAPVLIGWVVFAERLDAAQMRNLEQLSAIPLSAAVVLNRTAGEMRHGPITIQTPDGPSMRLDRPLPSFDGRPVPLAVLTEQLAAPTVDVDLARQA